MRLVLYRSDHCPACRRLSAELRRLCAGLGGSLEEKDVVVHLEEAAALGVTRPPAVAMNGRLLGQGSALLAKLRKLHR
ncbi:MAG: glutaredoxin [Pseudomonadota bacterium]|nr:hypothetical protein [Nevskiales bacterium]MEC9364745.1 glutaredoxin [Pseudomonadota bacterium]